MYNQFIQQNDSKVLKPILLLGLALWLVVGLSFFVAYGHHDLIFPVVIVIWLLIAFIFLCITLHWKGRTVLLVPILTIVFSIFSTYLYWGYRDWVAERTLDEFISAVASQNMPERFSISDDGLAQLDKNISLEYSITGKDSFFGARDWWITFDNGAACYITMVPVSHSRWSVSAFQE
ncbi:MAG: hypothetical protein CVU44_21105 [Chloroflexi bacterium HGW-Chloroflexi-6]|nr:MAG: hypothetical protein CVU44_21105 [Chloroflexi bacterium HGW-Chloroflexi-6]